MNDAAPLPRFKKPPVSEVVLGIQFPSIVTPVHLGAYYQKVKDRFPKTQTLPPILPVIETFGTVPLSTAQFAITQGMQPRIWFLSEDDNYLIQLQSDRLLVNWRAGTKGAPYPHFEAVQQVFLTALDELEALLAQDNVTAAVNQCELVYINPILATTTGIPISEPQRIFRICSAQRGP